MKRKARKDVAPRQNRLQKRNLPNEAGRRGAQRFTKTVPESH